MQIKFDSNLIEAISEQEQQAARNNEDFVININGKPGSKDFVTLASYCIFDFSKCLAEIPKKLNDLQEAIMANTQAINQIATLNNKVKDLTEKLESKEKQIDENTKVINEQKLKIQSLERKAEANEESVLALERYSRNFNLRINGIKEEANENPEKCIEKAKAVILKVSGVQVGLEYAHRVGQRRNDGPRTMIMKCYSRIELNQILKKRKDFFNARYPLHRDLPKRDLEEKLRHADVMKRKFEDGDRVAFTRGFWHVNGVKYVPE